MKTQHTYRTDLARRQKIAFHIVPVEGGEWQWVGIRGLTLICRSHKRFRKRSKCMVHLRNFVWTMTQLGFTLPEEI